MTTAADIFAAEDLRHEDVPVPEWSKDGDPCVIRMQELPADDALKFTEQMDLESNKRHGMYLIIVLCARDVEGNTLFTDEDVPRLKKKKLAILNRLQHAALRVNGMAPEVGVALKKDSSEADIAASLTS